MKIGFFGGSFDPIHLGHIYLAIQMLEICGLDQVLFCPAKCSPFKTNALPLASDELRRQMINTAISEIPQFKICEEELNRPAPSFTIDTIRILKQKIKADFYLILSLDAALHLQDWKEANELIELAPPLIGKRGAKDEISGPWKKQLQKHLVATSCFDISSTEIRNRIRNKLYVGHLLPKQVLEIISLNHLYC